MKNWEILKVELEFRRLKGISVDWKNGTKMKMIELVEIKVTPFKLEIRNRKKIW